MVSTSKTNPRPASPGMIPVPVSIRSEPSLCDDSEEGRERGTHHDCAGLLPTDYRFENDRASAGARDR